MALTNSTQKTETKQEEKIIPKQEVKQEVKQKSNISPWAEMQNQARGLNLDGSKAK